MGTIKKKTGVNLFKIKPIKCVGEINLPGFFLVCKGDIIARPDKVKNLYNKYKGKWKEFHLIPGEHQTQRENTILVTAIYFLLKCLGMGDKHITRINRSFFQVHKDSQDVNLKI